MMGPAPDSFVRGEMLEGEWPMPEPERKATPRHTYRKAAVLSAMAATAGTSMAGFKSDGRHMFFQFKMRPEEERTCSFLAIVWLDATDENGAPIFETDGSKRKELWFVQILGTCMNMGSRNASKVAQSFCNEWLEAFSKQLDEYVFGSWVHKQNQETRDLICLLYTSPSPRDQRGSRMPSSA